MAAAGGVRGASLVAAPEIERIYPRLSGEPGQPIVLPASLGAVQGVSFLPPDDPSTPYVADRDYAVVVCADGSAFLGRPAREPAVAIAVAAGKGSGEADPGGDRGRLVDYGTGRP